MNAPIWTFAPFLALVFAASVTGAVFRPGVWYERLDKPSWTPPDWLFPAAWFVLYGLMAYGAWRVWSHEGTGLALGIWGLQLVLNAGWSVILFGLRSPLLALFEVSALWLAIAATVTAFARVDVVAGGVLIPYLVWVSFAAALNLAIVRRQHGAP